MSLLLVLFYYSLPDAAHELLSYQSDLIAAGEWWRLFSGQLLHFELSHLGLNVAVFWVMYLLFAEHAASWRYAILIGSLTLMIGIAMYCLRQICRVLRLVFQRYSTASLLGVLALIYSVKFGLVIYCSLGWWRK